MGITVYPPPAVASGSSSATTTDSTKYSWGTPKLGTCMQFTAECSNACFCFCCRDVTAVANGANVCTDLNGQWALHPLGDNCVLVGKVSCWNFVGQVFAISDSGVLSSKGTCCELFNWMCEWSCCSPDCCCNSCPQHANQCVRNILCRAEGTDASGRFYALLTYNTNNCGSTGYDACAHVKTFCFNPTDNSWCDICTFKNGTGPNANPDCAVDALISNPAKGLVSVRSHYCNCTGSNCQCTAYFVHGVRCAFKGYCTGCTTTLCQNRPVYFGRYSDNNFYAMFHCSDIAGKVPGYQLRVDFENCTVTKGDCMPGLTVKGCVTNINPHGGFPISGSTVNYLMTNFFFNEGQGAACCWAKLTNTYVTNNGSIYDKMEVCTLVCDAGCFPDEQLAKGMAFAEWTYGNRTRFACNTCPQFCSTCNNRCQFNCMGAKMVNGYYATNCQAEVYDTAPIRGDTDYAPFSVAIGKVCVKKGITDATGCATNCHRSAVVVGSDWIAQLCENGEATGFCCAKLVIYGVNSSCGS